MAAVLAIAGFSSAPASAATEATLLIEADSGKVLHAENATVPWYPASLTKLMTAYVTLQAVKNGRLTLDTLLPVSARAAAQQPSKMGFKPGVKVTVDNALKMMMVKSANDIAVVLAEGVSGSVEKFADEMNRTSKNLGMTQSNWVNPNGLPAEEQISSARDMGILARALLHDFPEYDLYWHIPAIRFGKKVMRNYNTLIGRYQGADGMKTGFICASGFNLVASATRNGKRLIAVVLGAPSSPYRGAKAAGLLERGFQRGLLSWLAPSLGSLESLQPVNTTPPDLREAMCGPHRKRPAAEEADDDSTASETGADSPQAFMLSSLPPGAAKPSALLSQKPAPADPIVVYAGPARKPADTQFAAVRAKLAKAGKAAKGRTDVTGSAGDTHDASAQPARVADASASAVPPAHTNSPRPGAFAQPPTQHRRTARTLPAVTDGGRPPVLSFAPAARAEPAPLTATPDAKAESKRASVPLPRPRPKLADRRKAR